MTKLDRRPPPKPAPRITLATLRRMAKGTATPHVSLTRMQGFHAMSYVVVAEDRDGNEGVTVWSLDRSIAMLRMAKQLGGKS